VLHCIKLYSNAETLPQMKPMVSPRTTVLTIQNGVTSADILGKVFGAEKVLPGAVYIEAALAGPGRIEQSGSTARIEFGERDGSRSERVQAIAKLLDKPGLQVAMSQNITATLWTKLVAVGAVGTAMTAARASLPEVLAGPEGERTIRTVMEEIVAVGQSRGVKFPPNVVEQRLSAVIPEAEEFKSSLQFDLYAGRPLELDDLLGSVVRMGRENGIPVPASAALVMTLEKFKHGKPR
jgi:2-dehydropantoate 2-reductase